MNTSLRRSVLVALIALATMIGGLFRAGLADAQALQIASLAFTSDPRDPIGQGLSYSYSTQAGDVIGLINYGYHIEVQVASATGTEWWTLSLTAPPGQTLLPGTYTGATANNYNGPSMNFFGRDLTGVRTCSEGALTGSFTIINAVFGPLDYVQTFDATFEQHCDSAPPNASLRGEVHIANPPPPPLQEFGLTVATDGTVSKLTGEATVHGTLTCTQATTVYVDGTVTQVDKKGALNSGTYATPVDCAPGATLPWTATTNPDHPRPFSEGVAEVMTHAHGYDPAYGRYVHSQPINTTVTLHKTKE